MTRMNDWEREIHETLKREVWSLRGPNQIVKVLPLGGNPAVSLGGYITIGFFLIGMTPLEIERALGLPPCYLANGARIYRFTRLPVLHEYEYELTTNYPGGLAYNPTYSNPAYPPGSRFIHQWRIKHNSHIPVDSINFLDLHPGQPFPYNWLI